MDFPQFVDVFLSARMSGKIIKTLGESTDTVHSYSEGEKIGFVEHINEALGEDPELNADLPIDPNTMDIFDVVAKGVVLW